MASSFKQAWEKAELELMELPAGYLLPLGMTMKDVLRIDAELLASEGIDLIEREGPPEGGPFPPSAP